jgi:hypothetical protein
MSPVIESLVLKYSVTEGRLKNETEASGSEGCAAAASLYPQQYSRELARVALLLLVVVVQ